MRSFVRMRTSIPPRERASSSGAGRGTMGSGRAAQYEYIVATLMDHKGESRGEYLFITLLGLALISLTNAQSVSCPVITVNDLGVTTALSTEGLISRAIVPLGEASGTRVPVRIFNFTRVCDASGDRRDTSSFVSVVVEFQCMSDIASLTVCDGSTDVTRQYQFQCIEDNGQAVWDNVVSGSSLFVQTVNPTATLSTPLANRCRRCIDDRQSSRADTTNHCDREFIYK